ncbi:nardilysin-like [Rosa rugosa]|uniref:nardilysin-like n=1 Tax=Rosa rugosa TaxID=74645 RepID=UPI002B400B91|nr:nardilysin-like [Rosa rugosa]
MGRCTFSSDDIVIKSPNDKKLYRLIKLENGLTALLIHDPEIYPQGSKGLEPSEEDEAAAKGGDGASKTKKAAAAMCVGMGSFSDHMEAQGLAHFLEHMLFMGSTKFPVENEYNSYLSKHGGSSNAYTKEEHTCYHFDVKREFLKGALKRLNLVWLTLIVIGILYRLEAVNDVPMLNLAWTLPCLTQHYLKSPEYYLWHLLAHESRGGLQFYLKTRRWAVSLSAWVESYSVAYVFGMNIYLTDSGLEKIFEIIGVVYQYIKLLRQVSPQKWIFQELQDIRNICFRFVEEQPQDDYASELAGNLLLYPAEHVISAQCGYEIWDEELIEYVLSFFRPDNMRMDVISKFSTMSKDFQCEPWFGSHYIEEDVSPFLMDLWKDPPEIDVSLHLREKNEFIPSDFSIRSDGLDTTYTSSPTCILDVPLLKFWYKLDRTFKVPRANIYFRISLKGGFDDLKSSLLTVLYIDLLRDELNEILYQASFALLDTSLYVNNCYLELKLWGFNDKLPAVLSTILTTTKNFLLL